MICMRNPSGVMSMDSCFARSASVGSARTASRISSAAFSKADVSRAFASLRLLRQEYPDGLRFEVKGSNRYHALVRRRARLRYLLALTRGEALLISPVLRYGHPCAACDTSHFSAWHRLASAVIIWPPHG